MHKLIERERLPFDGHEHDGYLFQLKGQDYKDAYITLFASDNFNLVKSVFDKFPHCSGCTKRILRSNGQTTRHYEQFKRKTTGFFPLSLFDMELQNIDFYEAITQNKFIDSLGQFKIKDDFIKISMNAKLNKFIERVSRPFLNNTRPQLKLLKGSIK